MQIRHGDVFLVQLAGLPASARKTDDTSGVLAYGEVTGHAHRVLPSRGGVALYEAPKTNSRFMVIDAPSTLTHEEHGNVALDPGTYEVKIQRTWDYLEEMERKVVD